MKRWACKQFFVEVGPWEGHSIEGIGVDGELAWVLCGVGAIIAQMAPVTGLPLAHECLGADLEQAPSSEQMQSFAGGTAGA